jgi:hypothetical protein
MSMKKEVKRKMFKPKKKVVEGDYEVPAVEEVEEEMEEEVEEEQEEEEAVEEAKPVKKVVPQPKPKEAPQVNLTAEEVISAIEFNLARAHQLLALLK